MAGAAHASSLWKVFKNHERMRAIDIQPHFRSTAGEMSILEGAETDPHVPAGEYDMSTHRIRYPRKTFCSTYSASLSVIFPSFHLTVLLSVDAQQGPAGGFTAAMRPGSGIARHLSLRLSAVDTGTSRALAFICSPDT